MAEGLVYEPDSKTLYLLNQAPKGLVVYDTSNLKFNDKKTDKMKFIAEIENNVTCYVGKIAAKTKALLVGC